MANRTGAKWNKGGKLSRNRMIAIDFSNFSAYAEKLEELGASLEDIFAKSMEKAAEKVQEDVKRAVEPQNLPAGGRFRGRDRDTENSIITDTKPERRGSTLEVKLGFDKTKPGAGGFLITGTPKMAPDRALADLFQNKKYAKEIQKQIEKDLQDEIDKRTGGT